MPDRPGVDDNEGLNALIELWQAAADEIDARLAGIWDEIRRELAATPLNRNQIARLKAQAGRLETLADDLAEMIDGLAADTASWATNGGGVEEVYGAGAAVAAGVLGVGFVVTGPHRSAIDALAADLVSRAGTAAGFVTEDGAGFAQQVAREIAGLRAGPGGVAAAEQALAVLRDGFNRRGLGAVVYSNGSRHSFGEYAAMLLRTSATITHNMGALNHSRANGVQWYQISDGLACGLTEHFDTQKADGLIVDYDTASAYPLAHIGCVRQITPRPDLVGPEDGLETVPARERRADIDAFIAALAAQSRGSAGGGGRRPRRRRRARR